MLLGEISNLIKTIHVILINKKSASCEVAHCHFRKEEFNLFSFGMHLTFAFVII